MSDREAYTPISDDDLTTLLKAFSYSRLARSAFLELRDQRAERVKLQDENESLRHDLRQATSEPRCGEVPASDTPSVRDLHDIVERLTALVERQAEAGVNVEQRLAKLQYSVIVELGEQVEALAERLAKVEQIIAVLVLEQAPEQVQEAGQPSDDGPPRRGDRVRLEGAMSIGGSRIPDGWYDVAGSTLGDGFQIARAPFDFCWVDCRDTGLKEVRRGAGPAASAPLPDAESDAPAKAEAWAAAELHPQRGDRVRLEGACTSVSGTSIADGWYDVVGRTDGEFQIIAMRYSDGGHWLAWVPPGDHVKEIRPGAAKLDE